VHSRVAGRSAAFRAGIHPRRSADRHLIPLPLSTTFPRPPNPLTDGSLRLDATRYKGRASDRHGARNTRTERVCSCSFGSRTGEESIEARPGPWRRAASFLEGAWLARGARSQPGCGSVRGSRHERGRGPQCLASARRHSPTTSPAQTRIPSAPFRCYSDRGEGVRQRQRRERARVTGACSGYGPASVSSTKAASVLSGGRKKRRRPTLTVWLWLTAAAVASFVAAAAVIARV
jgi:hypothetical protein